jgi:hypothetical protein
VGKSKKGEGGTQSVTTDMVARALARELSSEGREADLITVNRVTDNLYAVALQVRGENEQEQFFLSLSES